ncbi:hypothetical protein K7X08_028006 [Anisodus acutangulus]|uniref:EF-hand domain-containing protein n=2 Tax=Anisodus TaxID=243963 RepID=A0A9Q1MXN2_9SOLA|nr:hypothetical protein K7X08_028006 [Anisodus acutangulus]
MSSYGNNRSTYSPSAPPLSDPNNSPPISSNYPQSQTSSYGPSSSYGYYHLRFLRNPSEYFSRIGPKEFAALWSYLGQWRAIFERFGRDRSGKIDATELRDALYSLGYMVPPSVLEVLISRYTDGSGRRPELCFDSFVECGMVVKGLTEKFKEKDMSYTGSAKLNYDEFMSMILPFIVSY